MGAKKLSPSVSASGRGSEPVITECMTDAGVGALIEYRVYDDYTQVVHEIYLAMWRQRLESRRTAPIACRTLAG